MRREFVRVVAYYFSVPVSVSISFFLFLLMQFIGDFVGWARNDVVEIAYGLGGQYGVL